MFYYSFSAYGPNKMGVGSAVAVIMFFVVILFGAARILYMRNRSA
jgi:ABC-type sugar transport system permease subunit